MKPHQSTTREQILEKALGLTRSPVAFEAYWDGDSTGWFIKVTAIFGEQDECYLGTLQFGGDMRLFQSAVPPWPEAKVAAEIGGELSRQFAAPFYFPSPNVPEDQCPRWWQRSLGYPCSWCGIPLLQDEKCPWHGLCYSCYRKAEHEKKAASWTAEERAGPKCSMCGDPAKGVKLERQLCRRCLPRYTEFKCPRCNTEMLISSSNERPNVCWSCEHDQLMSGLTDEQKAQIRQIRSSHDLIGAIKEVRKLVGVTLAEAQNILASLK